MTKEELQKFTELAKRLSDECPKTKCKECPFYRKYFDSHRCGLSERPPLWKLDAKEEPYELKIDKIYTLDEFREKYIVGSFDEKPLDYTRHREFRSFLDSCRIDIWDYPISELDYILEEHKKVVPVTDGKEIRFYETEDD